MALKRNRGVELSSVLNAVHHEQGPITSRNGINSLYDVPSATMAILQLHHNAIICQFVQPISERWRSGSLSEIGISQQPSLGYSFSSMELLLLHMWGKTNC
jgi:hypothetical protein